ncbi:hypothetical protein HYV79_02590 [Candidatus Woesearchaeota archaeon]|nr:hypothetical protein [Candidatus Woesearchaeota archaeon]
MIKKSVFIGILICIILLAGCAEEKKEVATKKKFIGGKDAVIATFDNLRSEVNDVDDEFNVVVKLKNQGESDVKKEDATIRLTGIHPEEFSKTETEFTLHPENDLLSMQLDSEGNIIDSSPEFIEFKGLKHITPIKGSQITLPLVTDVCYLYKTEALTKLCVRKDLQKPSEDFCKVTSDQDVANSGAPLHVQNMRQTPLGKNKIRFIFDLVHVGDGSVYEQKSGGCEVEKKRNKVFLKIDTGLPGLDCSGFLSKEGSAVTGTATLYNNKKTISCTQTFEELGDYEKPVFIDLMYDYNQRTQTDLTVKHVEE